MDLIMEDEEGGEGATHFDRPILLPDDLENYEGKFIVSPGRPGIPATVPSWSQADEKKVLDILIKELNEKFLAGLDTDPNLSRSSKRPQLYPAFRSGSIETAAFVGGSNAKKLSQAAANLGIDSYMLAKSRWKITKDNIEKLIPDLRELMSSLPAGTPIILFCLDNSSFLAASDEGGLLPISKCVPEDDGFHVNRSLVVAPECAMQVTLDLLKKLMSELSEYQFFIISPITRYISGSCCNAENHVSNSGDPDFLSTILSGLTKLKFLLRKKLAPATVLDGIELICGPGCSRERTADLAMPVLPVLSTITRTLELPGIAPKGATVPIPDILQATIRGRLTAAGVDTKEAVVTAEAEDTAVNAAAATSWEGSPAEAGVGPGTAGRAVPHSTWKLAS